MLLTDYPLLLDFLGGLRSGLYLIACDFAPQADPAQENPVLENSMQGFLTLAWAGQKDQVHPRTGRCWHHRGRLAHQQELVPLALG